MEQIRLVVVCQRPVIAECVAQVLHDDPRFAVVGAFGFDGDVRGLVGQIGERQRPLLAVVDERIAARAGHQFVTTLRDVLPNIAFVVLSDGGADQLVVELLRNGIDGYVPAGSTVEELRQAVWDTARGRTSVPYSALTQAFVRLAYPEPGDVLSKREVEILHLLSDGRSTKEIAGRLALQTNTVRDYVQVLLGKLGVHSRLAAVAEARRRGLLPEREFPTA